MSEQTLRAYQSAKDEMFAPSVLPANVIGAGLSSNLRSSFQNAAQAPAQNNDNAPAVRASAPQVNAQSAPDQTAKTDIVERANLAGQTLGDSSQKGMKVQSAAGYLGGQMAEMGKELMTGLFGALKDKKPDDGPAADQAEPPKFAMRSAPGMASGL